MNKFFTKNLLIIFNSKIILESFIFEITKLNHYSIIIIEGYDNNELICYSTNEEFKNTNFKNE